MSGAETFYIHETTKDFIVYENKNLVFSNFQIVMPYLERFDNS